MFAAAHRQIPTAGKDAGAVTAIAISQDHTFIAVGHASGAIHLYALAKPATPARSVIPTTLQQVQAGRAEGHIIGSQIRHLGFVGARHTAIVSADDHGLAFFHSLGQVLGLANTDVVRILGQYPETQQPAPALPELRLHNESQGDTLLADAPISTSKQKLSPLVFDMAPLPLGPVADVTDTFSLVAIITPTKIIVVGLKPTPRTWWRALQKNDAAQVPEDTEPVIGSLAWFPCARVSVDEPKLVTRPLLAFTWGRQIHLISVGAHEVAKATNGAQKSRSTKALHFREEAKWLCESTVVRLQWLNSRVKAFKPYMKCAEQVFRYCLCKPRRISTSGTLKVYCAPAELPWICVRSLCRGPWKMALLRPGLPTKQVLSWQHTMCGAIKASYFYSCASSLNTHCVRITERSAPGSSGCPRGDCLVLGRPHPSPSQLCQPARSDRPDYAILSRPSKCNHARLARRRRRPACSSCAQTA